MASNYLQLTNKVLRKLNEVELSATQFASARGMQAVAKDSVADAVREIMQQKWQWPFLAVQNVQLLQPGENEYAWPLDFSAIDWLSFQILKDELNPKNTTLKVINREDWYRHLKDLDEDADPGGIKVPEFVFRAHGNGFGVSPAPDKAYQIEFRYFREPIELTNAEDICEIPSKYDNIIVWGALVHMNLFRENVEGNQVAEAKFQQGIKNMYTALVGNTLEGITDTRVNFGGQIYTEHFK